MDGNTRLMEPFKDKSPTVSMTAQFLGQQIQPCSKSKLSWKSICSFISWGCKCSTQLKQPKCGISHQYSQRESRPISEGSFISQRWFIYISHPGYRKADPFPYLNSCSEGNFLISLLSWPFPRVWRNYWWLRETKPQLWVRGFAFS